MNTTLEKATKGVVNNTTELLGDAGLLGDKQRLLGNDNGLMGNGTGLLGNQTMRSANNSLPKGLTFNNALSNDTIYNIVSTPATVFDDFTYPVTTADDELHHNTRAIRSFTIVFSLAAVCLVLWAIYILLYHKDRVLQACINIIDSFKGHRGVKREHEATEHPPSRRERRVRSTLILRRWFSKSSSLHDQSDDEHSENSTPGLLTSTTKV